MTFKQFCERLLLAIYQESRDKEGWVSFAYLSAKYDFAADRTWPARAFQYLKEQNLIKSRSLQGGSEEALLAELTGTGLMHVEDVYGSKGGVDQLLELRTTEAESAGVTDKVSISSSSWTGLPTDFQLTEQRRGTLVSLLSKAESDLDQIGAGNSEKAMARSYIVAARALAEAPEPPTEIIWEIINRANALSGIASLFVAIIALFAAAH